MFVATTVPTSFQRQAGSSTGHSFERFLKEAQVTSRRQTCAATQDDKSYTLTFDIPGIAREHLNIGIEGNVVRIETKDGAPRQYRLAYELPQDIDVAASEAKLENGVLTLKLGKQVPASKVTELVIN